MHTQDLLDLVWRKGANGPTAGTLTHVSELSLPAARQGAACPDRGPAPAEPLRFADLFAGIGGFHAALSHAGGRCVFVSEIDPAARATYLGYWGRRHGAGGMQVNADIAEVTPDTGDVDVPEHDVLTAGFPCQPFSKSGFQRGMDEARGTLFWNIARVLETRRPSVVLLENVRNLAGPKHRHEWNVIVTTLRRLGYRVSSSPTVFSPHFLPPSRGGTPQVRDRVFILGTYVGPKTAESEINVPPTVLRGPVDGWDPMAWSTDWILDDDADIDHIGRYRLSTEETSWINAWDHLVRTLATSRGYRLPGFPLWADEWLPERRLAGIELAGYPRWKADILLKNARFYDDHRDVIDDWRRDYPEFQRFPASRRKLEWQAQDSASLWDTVMHLRPSGIRAKAPTYLPALVAITQTSIIGSRERRITPREAARLQGLPADFEFSNTRDSQSYKQVGNGVSVGAAWHVLREHVLDDDRSRMPRIPDRVRRAMLDAPLNPSPGVLSPMARQVEESLRAERDVSSLVS